MRAPFLLVALLLLPAGRASAEWQFKPFLGATFAGSSTFFADFDGSSQRHLAVGVSAMKLGEVFGVEGDVAHVPHFFESSGPFSQLVLGSSATTVTGNVIVAMPRKWSEYTLRPYFVGGGGMMHAQIDSNQGVLTLSTSLAAWDMGVGVTGFLTDRVGVSWEVRRFRSVGGKDEGLGLSLGVAEFSFWRANMALAIRY